MREMTGFRALRAQSRITWIERDRGWIAVPEDMVSVLSSEGFEECKRETTTSRRDSHPAGGIWQGVDPRTGSVASAVWVNHAEWPHALVYVEAGVCAFGHVNAWACAASREIDVDDRAGSNGPRSHRSVAGLGSDDGTAAKRRS